jgi:rubrerythrin
MAMESDSQSAMMTAIKQIVGNCAIDEVDVEKLPMFDLEFFFVRLRAKSIGEEVELNLRHPSGYNKKDKECDHASKFKLNLMEVEVQKSVAHEDKILLDEKTGTGIKLKYPTAEMADSVEYDPEKNQLDLATDAIISCIDYIYDEDNVYNKTDYTQAELVEFIENLSQEQFQKLSEFFDTMPKLKHTIKWKCTGCGQDEEVTLEGLANFFG